MLLLRLRLLWKPEAVNFVLNSETMEKWDFISVA